MVLATLSVAVGLLAEAPATIDAAAIPNYHRLRPGLVTAGQPSADALKQLKQLGFKTVINLRTEAEGAKDEEKVVTDQGLRYVWVPVTPATLNAKDVEAVAVVLDDADAAPVLLHCSIANRAGGLWAAFLARKGTNIGEAEAEGVKAGLSSLAMKEAVRRVAAPEPRP